MNKLLTAILCTLAVTTAWATDETITFSELGYSNAQEITTVNGTNFTITFNKGTNSNAPNIIPQAQLFEPMEAIILP